MRWTVESRTRYILRVIRAEPIPLIARAQLHRGRIAISDESGSYTYEQLLTISGQIASALLSGASDLEEQRVAFLVAPGLAWVAVQWGIWRAGGVAVPLPAGSAQPEIEYFLEDSYASIVIFDSAAAALIEPIAASRRLRARSYSEVAGCADCTLPAITPERRAMMLYTSGTTSRPKGVVSTHANITAQITSLIGAWEWTDDDRIILCLPLHHIHGIINILCCALWSGASCKMLPRFDAEAVWTLIASGEISLFMAVPTVYVRLIAFWESRPEDERSRLSKACARLRLMVSGSAALPVSTLERWREISGHTLLERYGMTEIGMALSNPLHGTRLPGCVGSPLPSVEVQLVNDAGEIVPPGTPGEIEVRGATVFLEYWRREDATRAAFRNGWFRTGDTAILEHGSYRILGRTSIDILKSGGHKISALEIEETLREHPAIAECAVVGVPDAEWGERIAAAIVLHPGNDLDLAALRSWGRELLAAYKLPSRLLVVDALPRNAMGKVVKPDVTAMLEATAVPSVAKGSHEPSR